MRRRDALLRGATTEVRNGQLSTGVERPHSGDPERRASLAAERLSLLAASWTFTGAARGGRKGAALPRVGKACQEPAPWSVPALTEGKEEQERGRGVI